MNRSATNISQVRIIAGRWRGRKIAFPTNLSIRPTPDRVRETVFNWLSPYLNNRRCLDLFAGSGVLGFEALSRGASEIVFVDSEKTIVHNLQKQHQIFNIESDRVVSSAEYVHSDGFTYLASLDTKFDLVFLDPPYLKNMIQPSIQLLVEHNVMATDGLIYIEMAKEQQLPDIPDDWSVLKNKVMSQVACYLIQTS